jgi:hypothetical protein
MRARVPLTSIFVDPPLARKVVDHGRVPLPSSGDVNSFLRL